MSSLQTNRNYYARLLSGSELALYEKCVDHLTRGKYTVTGDIDDIGRAEEIGNAVATAVIIGCPEMFYLDQNVTVRASGDKITLVFANKYPEKELVAMKGELDREIERICKKIRTYDTTYDKIYRLNQYLCRRVEPIMGAESKYSDAYAALINREARCEGFAKAAKLILDRLGIESVVVNGEAYTEYGTISHAWNIIVCDGQPYHFDFTWNAGLTVNKAPGIPYMFLSDAEISLDHYTGYEFPPCENASKEPWNVADGNVRYISDIARAKPIPLGKDYVVPIRFMQPMDADEINSHCMEWGRNELSPQNISVQQTARYLPRLNVLLYYFLNE